MKIRWGRVALVFVILLALAGAAALVAPSVDAGAARAPLARALEKTLGRPVELHDVRYQVLPLPGISATDVVIPDDPAFGLDALAYVGEIQVGVSWTSLLAGRLEISSVRLVDASVNLTRRDELGWNFARLLERMAREVRQGSAPPALLFRGARVNFRNGTLKSPFYLNAVDLDLQPSGSASGPLEWSYEASPARTDRAEQGFGRFTGRGRWTPGNGPDGRLQVDLELERTVVSELLTLITGRDLGVQGRFTSRATLDGPVDALRVRGSLELEDVERSSFFGLRGSRWALDYEGSLNLTGQQLTVATVKPKQQAPLPLAIEVGCSRILVDPAWTATVQFDEIPAPALLDLGRRLGVIVPEGLKVEGTVVGSVRYGQAKPLEGSVQLRRARVSLGEAGPLALEEAQISLDGQDVLLEPAAVKAPSGNEMQISGRWRPETEGVEFRLDTEKLGLEELRAALTPLKGVPAVPLLDACETGTIGGSLRLERRGETEAAPEWNGDVHLSGLKCTNEGMARGWTLATGRLALNGSRWQLSKAQGEWGPWKFGLDAGWQASAHRPVKVALQLETVEGKDIDDFFRPALAARRGFLDRTLRRQLPLPAWLRARHAEGELRVKKLKLGGEEFTDFSSHLYWDGAALELPDVSARWDEASYSGRLGLTLGGEKFDYRAKGRVDGIAFQGGKMEAELDATLTTLAGPLSGALKGTGHFTARDVDAGEETLQAVSGCIDYDGERAGQRLKLPCLEVQTGGEWLTGTGASSAEGRLAASVGSSKRQMKLGGAVLPLQVEISNR